MIQTFISAFLKLGSFSCFIFYLLRVGRCEFFLLLLLFGFVAERQKNSEATGWSQVSLFGGISENRRVCWRWRCWTFGTIKPLMGRTFERKQWNVRKDTKGVQNWNSSKISHFVLSNIIEKEVLLMQTAPLLSAKGSGRRHESEKKKKLEALPCY